MTWQTMLLIRNQREPIENQLVSTVHISSLSVQMELLNKKMDNMNVSSHQTQDIIYAMNDGEQDMEPQDYLFSKQVNYMGNFQGGQKNFQRPAQNQFQNNRGQSQFQKAQVNPKNNLYSSTYYPGWRNHPNFSYKNQSALIPPQLDLKLHLKRRNLIWKNC